MRTVFPIALTLLLAACGGGSFGEGEVSGSLGDRSFGDDLTVFHGTSYIVIVDEKIDCLDMSWVTRNYFGSDGATSDQTFGAVQFSFPVETEPTNGTFAYDGTGESPIDVWRLLSVEVPANGSGPVQAETATAYNLRISEVTEDSVTGTFDTVFSDGAANGTFTSAFCRNVR